MGIGRAAAQVAHRRGDDEVVVGATRGFAGRDFEDRVTSELKMSLVRPDRRDEAPRHGSIGWIRQWIESVNDTLKGQLDLERHGGRTPEGTYARVAQRLLATFGRDRLPRQFREALHSHR
jgi:NAD(P)-dependent dehydrogenase (short-subunit alcohol dehydrogenase family)